MAEDVAGAAASPHHVVHPVYLPFSQDLLLQHFAAVGEPSALQKADPSYPERHLRYYNESAKLALAHQRRQHRDTQPAGRHPRDCTAQNHQVEKDERFWIVAALMALFHVEDRQQALAALLTSALGGTPPVDGFTTWADALTEDAAEPLCLFFEVHLPSPPSYKAWLAETENLNRQALIPWIRGKKVGLRQEAATKADALLIAPKTGFAVVFEAKVLSDASTHTERDATRNQLARYVDVLLEINPRLQPPLSGRRPERSCLVLVTPELFHNNPATRLYGHLMAAYRKDTVLLQQHLPHRAAGDLDGVPDRLGWTTFEEFNRIRPGACRWLE